RHERTQHADGDSFFRAFNATMLRDMWWERPVAFSDMRRTFADFLFPEMLRLLVPKLVLKAAVNSQIDIVAARSRTSREQLLTEWARRRRTELEETLPYFEQDIRNPDSWPNPAGDLIPYLAASAYGVRIHVFHEDARLQEIGDSDSGRPTITLFRTAASDWHGIPANATDADDGLLSGLGGHPSGPGSDDPDTTSSGYGFTGNTWAFRADVSESMANGLEKAIKARVSHLRHTGHNPDEDKTLLRLREQLATYPRHSTTANTTPSSGVTAHTVTPQQPKPGPAAAIAVAPDHDTPLSASDDDNQPLTHDPATPAAAVTGLPAGGGVASGPLGSWAGSVGESAVAVSSVEAVGGSSSVPGGPSAGVPGSVGSVAGVPAAVSGPGTPAVPAPSAVPGTAVPGHPSPAAAPSPISGSLVVGSPVAGASVAGVSAVSGA
ncbi:hypothetical protein AB0A89_35160, partial [Streptomyces albogriseolus]